MDGADCYFQSILISQTNYFILNVWKLKIIIKFKYTPGWSPVGDAGIGHSSGVSFGFTENPSQIIPMPSCRD